jgi:hypothetical protein
MLNRLLVVVAVLAAVVLGACATPEPSLVAVYRSPTEAIAVAHGSFGAVPLALVAEQELQFVAEPGAGEVVQVKLPSSEAGWVVTSSLSQAGQERHAKPGA